MKYPNPTVTRLPLAEEKLRNQIGEAIGAGSSCWDNLEGAGVFQSERAVAIVDELVGQVIETTGLGEPSLGCATNAELVAELAARYTMDNTDADYRTADHG